MILLVGPRIDICICAAQTTCHLTDHLMARCAPNHCIHLSLIFTFSTMASQSNFPYPPGAGPFVPAANVNPFGISGRQMPLSPIRTQVQHNNQSAVGPATGDGFRHGSGAGSPAIASPSMLRSLTRSASRTSTRRAIP